MGWLESKQVVKDERIQVAFLSAIGFGLVMGLYLGVITEHTPTTRTSAQKAGYLVEAIWEAAFFGFGLGFCLVYGHAIRSVESGPLRRRCIGIWISISYFFMSWFPHASGHQYLFPSDPTDFIVLETCFHWPNLIAAFILCWYQFDVLLISYDVAHNNKELRFWTSADEKPVPWYKQVKYHAYVISITTATAWAFLQRHFNPYPDSVNSWQKGLFIMIYIVDGLSSGVAFGFVYAASRITYRLPKARTRYIAGVSTAAIGFLLVIATPHPVVHAHYAFDPNGTLYVEYFFHLSITGAVAILAYYQHRFLVLSIKGRMGMMMRFKDVRMEETRSTSASDSEMQSKTGKGKSSKSSKSDKASGDSALLHSSSSLDMSGAVSPPVSPPITPTSAPEEVNIVVVETQG